jgi:cytochrome P450
LPAVSDIFTTVSVSRLSLQDYRFQDGTFIPAHSFLTASLSSVHGNAAVYTDPTEFKPWRFAEQRDEPGGSLRHQLTSTSPDYLLWGIGKHAW